MLFERHDFHRHAFDRIAAMNGEEAECAARIDCHPCVKRWVRNPDRETQGGFWLPKSPGRFFPDFIVELEGGVIAAVEYKNATLNAAPEEQHKRAVGELWAGRSDMRCRFVWVVERNWPELERQLSA